LETNHDLPGHGQEIGGRRAKMQVKPEKVVVFIPTYNERENVENILNQLLSLTIPLDVLFLDDNSPDGTGAILDDLAGRYQNVHVIHRTGKLGIGSAHLDGIRWAYDKEYRKLITMDCDLTHSPEYISNFMENSKDCDVVVGSRYLLKRSLEDWNWSRKLLTKLGHFLTKMFLKMPYDATGAFRVYRLDRIPGAFTDLIHSQGYSFFFESLYILHLNHFKIKEIPITLSARVYGHSKMRLRDALHSVAHLVHLYLTTLINREKYEIDEPFALAACREATSDSRAWDDYWVKKNQPSLLIYDLIAAFYRKFIIKRALNRYTRKYFHTGAKILHAGCGSGQVDVDIRDTFQITALDLSRYALKLYHKINKTHGELLHGSIMAIPVPDDSYDGIYNLGVMEHFNDADIQKILSEFNRVLKPNRKILLFWPPEFGLSVIFIKALKGCLKYFFKKDITFHPEEITRVRSKKQIIDLLADGGFRLTHYHFGIVDLFTYVILVGEKIDKHTLTAV
jgi:dolichol-phosphate mannosyltransferase